MKNGWKFAAGMAVVMAIIVGGCAKNATRRAGIPGSAAILASQKQSVQTVRVKHEGKIYVFDNDDIRCVASFNASAGQVVKVDAQANKITRDDAVLFEDVLKSDHWYTIFLDRRR
ncbi:MAG TPA: hypothetical protein VIL86_00790 [Tepidisphaeraceae bacterium]|jgi:hypothetical protein